MPNYGILSPGRPGTPAIKIEKKSFTVGRDASCDVVLKAPGVLPFHGYFTVNHNGELFVRRGGERGHLSVGGHEVQCAARIKHGDEIQLGEARYSFDKAPSLQATGGVHDLLTPQRNGGAGKLISKSGSENSYPLAPVADQIQANHRSMHNFFTPQANLVERSPPTISCEPATPPFVTPRQDGVFFPLTGGTTFQTPNLQSNTMELKSVNSGWPSSKPDSMAMSENSVVEQSFMTNSEEEILVEQPSMIMSGNALAERDVTDSVAREQSSTVVPQTISSRSPTVLSSLSDHGSQRETVNKSESFGHEESASSINVDCVLFASSRGSAAVETSLPTMVNALAQLSLCVEDARFTRATELSAIEGVVIVPIATKCSTSIGVSVPAASLEAKGSRGETSRKPPLKRVASPGEGQVVGTLVQPERKKKLAPKRTRKTSVRTTAPTAEETTPKASPPIASRTRSRTACQSEKQPASPQGGTFEKVGVKRGVQSAALKAGSTARTPRTASKGQKKSGVRKSAKSRQLFSDEGETAVTRRRGGRGLKH